MGQNIGNVIQRSVKAAWLCGAHECLEDIKACGAVHALARTTSHLNRGGAASKTGRRKQQYAACLTARPRVLRCTVSERHLKATLDSERVSLYSEVRFINHSGATRNLQTHFGDALRELCAPRLVRAKCYAQSPRCGVRVHIERSWHYRDGRPRYTFTAKVNSSDVSVDVSGRAQLGLRGSTILPS
jgi:hypothetical protein